MARLGEDVTEVLDYVPGRFRVIRHVRPKYACRRCDAITQAPAPALPTPRGRAAPGMLAHLLVSKYCAHLPLYRQSQIYARDGLDLDRSTLSDWVGQAVWLLQPIVDGIRNHVFAAEKVHADDTPVPVLEPGLGRTRTGRLWVYVRDDRPFCGPAPPAAVYFYSPDRGGEHPAAHLAHFTGFLQADAYSGFAALYEPRKAGPGLPMMPAITEVACWAHCRRSIFDVWQSTKSTVARAALDRISKFYAIDDKARFVPQARGRCLFASGFPGAPSSMPAALSRRRRGSRSRHHQPRRAGRPAPRSRLRARRGSGEEPATLGARNRPQPPLVYGSARARGYNADRLLEALSHRGLPGGRPGVRRKTPARTFQGPLNPPARGRYGHPTQSLGNPTVSS